VALGLSLASLAGGIGAVTYGIVRMPKDYLDRPEAVPFWQERPGWMPMASRVGKNLLGVVVIATGVVLAVPGVPGPGVLTLLIGVVLLDVPGKHRIQRRIVGAPKVLAAVNRLRAGFGRSPLRIQNDAAPPAIYRSRTEMPCALHVPPNRINAILNESRGLTADTALRLARFFGTAAEFWMSLQKTYELRVAEREVGPSIKREVARARPQRSIAPIRT
jgi:addiction module HigA family antidote